jgi:hypothetical protein
VYVRRADDVGFFFPEIVVKEHNLHEWELNVT